MKQNLSDFDYNNSSECCLPCSSECKKVEEKIKHDNIILLIPTLEDLLNDTIYKLDISKNIFYVPSWHNELYFDLKVFKIEYFSFGLQDE